jgi:uncharacterized membrane protein YdjX (TVP38/TMEM64 family)
MKRYWVRTIVLVALLLIAAGAVYSTVRFTPLRDFLTVESLTNNRDRIIALMAENLPLAILIYIAATTVIVALCIPIVSLIDFLGGLVFGVLFTAIYINIAVTVGSLLTLLAARYFLGDLIRKRFGTRMGKLVREIEEHGVNYLLAMRFITIPPLWILNVLVGITRIKTWTYVWTTSVGIIPGTIVYAYSGYAVGRLGGEGGNSIHIILALSLLTLLALLPVVVKKIRRRRSKTRQRTLAGEEK